jgi:hypothetical protein
VRYAAMPLWSTHKQETLLLDSSRWGKNIVPSQEPLTLYNCFTLSLNGLFTTTSSICSCEVITPGMTMSWVHRTTSNCNFISGVKCPLNASRSSFPKFLSSTPGFLLHTTNQSFTSSLLFQNSSWIFQFLLPLPSYVCFQNSELPCCIEIVLITICLNLASPRSIQNTGRTCIPILYVAWHFSGLTNDRTLRNQN